MKIWNSKQLSKLYRMMPISVLYHQQFCSTYGNKNAKGTWNVQFWVNTPNEIMLTPTDKLNGNSAAIQIQQRPQRRRRLNSTEEHSHFNVIDTIPHFSRADTDEEEQHNASLGYCLGNSLRPITLFIGEIRKGISTNTHTNNNFKQ